MNDYTWTENSEDSMNLAFKKDLSDSRKEWLYKYNQKNIIDGSENNIPIEKFIDNELIHFSNSDTLRSIGSICDGLKPSQRKILYCSFKRKLYKYLYNPEGSGGRSPQQKNSYINIHLKIHMNIYMLYK